MWPGSTPTSTPSFILIRPTVWPQCINVTQRQTDRKDRRGQTGQDNSTVQTVLEAIIFPEFVKLSFGVTHATPVLMNQNWTDDSNFWSVTPQQPDVQTFPNTVQPPHLHIPASAFYLHPVLQQLILLSAIIVLAVNFLRYSYQHPLVENARTEKSPALNDIKLTDKWITG